MILQFASYDVLFKIKTENSVKKNANTLPLQHSIFFKKQQYMFANEYMINHKFKCMFGYLKTNVFAYGK